MEKFSRAPTKAALVAWFWQRKGCHVEALALLDGAGLRWGELRLRSLFALELHRAFLDELGGRVASGWVVAARGLARLALGEVDAALGDLVAAAGQWPRFGLWLRAAAALAAVDPEKAQAVLEPLRGADPAALLLAHLAERSGTPERAERLLAGHAGRGRFAAEFDLLAANIASARNDPSAAEAATERALRRYGLPIFDRSAGNEDGPLVSIVVAAYDAERTIEAALRSLTAQSWRNIEVLVVDDASGDATASRAGAMADAEPRIRVLQQPVNQGAYAARNAGLAAARGAFIGFHDADDVAHPERIARQIAPLLNDAALAFTTARWVRRDAHAKFRCRQIVPLIRQHVGSVLVRRSFLGATGGFDLVRFGADGEWLLRLQVAAGPAGFKSLGLPLTLGGYDAHSAVHDPATGYGDRAFSLPRQAYRETRTRELISRLKPSR